MLKKTDGQTGFFGDFLYDQVLPKGHFLRPMRELIDSDRINEACSGLYSDTGRPGWEPAILFRMLLLQNLLEIPAREVEEQANLNLAFKWFIGLEANAKAPDATTLAAFKERLGADRFNEMNAIILEKAREKGLLAEKIFIAETDKFKLQGETYRVRKERPRPKSPESSKSADRPVWESVVSFFRELIGGRS